MKHTLDEKIQLLIEAFGDKWLFSPGEERKFYETTLAEAIKGFGQNPSFTDSDNTFNGTDMLKNWKEDMLNMQVLVVGNKIFSLDFNGVPHGDPLILIQ